MWFNDLEGFVYPRFETTSKSQFGTSGHGRRLRDGAYPSSLCFSDFSISFRISEGFEGYVFGLGSVLRFQDILLKSILNRNSKCN